MSNWIYDLECFPNFFSCAAVNTESHDCYVFEISERCDHSVAFRSFLDTCHHTGDKFVGFNNEGYDYPILDAMLNGVMSYQTAWEANQRIIGTPWDDRFKNIIPAYKRYIPQIDLYKIHHFDNVNRATSLKVLECNMRSESVEDLPYPPGTWLTFNQMQHMCDYNLNDIKETWRFYNISKPRIDFREQLTARYNNTVDFTNFNDGKIGKQYFIMKLNEAGISTHNGKDPIQSPRPTINLNDVIFPIIQFQNPEFNRVLQFIRSQIITSTKGVFDNVTCRVGGVEFVFGLGGIHASIEAALVASDDDYVVRDFDVESYYPRLGMVFRFFPEHLGEGFCDIYHDVFKERISHEKGTTENAMMKLALNSVYGETNQKFSCFYDPKYTMTTTVNGQLLLCMLAEWFTVHIPDSSIIQANTDGITMKIPRNMLHVSDWLIESWEQMTGLKMEANDYSRMFIKNVNGYIAEYAETGKLKRKKDYAYGKDFDWNQNHGSQIIAKAAEAYLINGVMIQHTIKNCTDIHDFLMNTKVPKNSKLMWGDPSEGEVQLQNVTRYYASKTGGYLTKVMPPAPRALDKTKDRRISILAGQVVWPCNNIADFTTQIDYDYYIRETIKLVDLNGVTPPEEDVPF